MGLMDLCQISPVSAGPMALAPDDSWEWDETDLTIKEAEPPDVQEPDLTHNLPIKPNLPLNGALPEVQSQLANIGMDVPASHCMDFSSLIGKSSSEVQHNINSQTDPSNDNIVQVYNLHNAELYQQPEFPLTSLRNKTKSLKKKQFLLNQISKDSMLSSVESLPDLLGGLMSNCQQGGRIPGFWDVRNDCGRSSEQSENSCRSDCESGIVSDTGDLETTTTNSEIQADEEVQGEDDGQKKLRNDYVVFGSPFQRDKSSTNEIYREMGWRRNEFRDETKEMKEDEKNRREVGDAVEILIKGHGILTPAESDSDFHLEELDVDSFQAHSVTLFKDDHYKTLGAFPVQDHQPLSPILSQHSSLESLLALDVKLFPSKDPLHRSASLENCLNPCSSTDREAGGSLGSPWEQGPGKGKQRDSEPEKEMKIQSNKGDLTSGELSRRTLDLLKRLENIQSPLVAKMTRSVSDMTLQSSSPQKNLFPVSPSLGGQPLSGVLGDSRKELPSLINKNSRNASLTELSSTEDSSLGSEDFATHGNQLSLFLDPTIEVNAKSESCRRRCQNNNRGEQGIDGTDVSNLSMVVNVSCMSSCTDDDEDDSDLLSSSTLTLTEEEFGVQEEEDGDKDRLSGASSGNEEDDEDNEEVESSYVLGLEYMKQELQSWIRSPRTSALSLSKTEVGLGDELQCGNASSSTFTSSGAKSIETNTMGSNNKTKREDREKEEENKRNSARSYISQFVDDVENGNVDQSCFKGKDEDDELLREESSMFTKKGDSLRELYANQSYQNVINLRANMDSSSTKQLCLSPSCEVFSFSSKPTSSLVGQLRGELPCHGATLHSPPSLSPTEDCRSNHSSHSSKLVARGRKAITIEEKFKFSSLVTEETKKETRAKDLSLPPKKRHKSHPCYNQLHSPTSSHVQSVNKCKTENVHDFVMEIIDMASVALKNKDSQTEGLNQNETTGSIQDPNPASLAKIRDKVLEHSHRPLQLRKGDFYSYLSLSSHDSDCGEVNQCAEDKSSTPVPYNIPSCTTPTQDLHSPSPELFTSTEHLASHFDQSSRCLSPSPNSNNLCSLDLKSAKNPAVKPPSPSLSAPPSPDIRDEETLFAACTEEVYLGPPLCYSMVLTKKPQHSLPKPSFESSLIGGFGSNEPAPCFSQQEHHLKHGETSSDQPTSKESAVNQFQDHLHFQRPNYREKTQRSFQAVPEPRNSSFSSFLLPSSDSSSPNITPSSPSFVSSSAKEEKLSKELYLSCDAAVGEAASAASVSTPLEERSRNEGPPYLNPWVHVALIDSFAAECLEDIKTLESNMGTIMTKISVCSSATNPSKEPTTAATRIIPKINCSAMKRADREERVRCEEVDTLQAMQEEKEWKGWSSSQQEATTTMVKQVNPWSVVDHTSRARKVQSHAASKLLAPESDG